MKTNHIKLLIITVSIYLLVFGVSGNINNETINMDATFPQYTEEELIKEADIIVFGKVVGHIKDYTMYGDIPFSDYNLKANKYIKAPRGFDMKELIVTQDGNSQLVFSNHPLMKANKPYMLFLKQSDDGKLIMVGGPNGKFNINNGKVIQQAKLLEENNLEAFIMDLEQKVNY